VQPANHVEQGAFSRTVAPNKRDYLSFVDMEGHPTEYLNIAVIGRYVLYTKHHESREALMGKRCEKSEKGEKGIGF
jgi:hypothetical protein